MDGRHFLFYRANLPHIFFILFVFFVFILAKDLYGEACALNASLIAATIPMVTVFGILFYTDLPGAALTALLFFLFYRKRYVCTGVVLGLLYLTKRSGSFFIPAIFLAITFDSSQTIFKKVKSLWACFLSAFLTILPDILWRQRHFTPASAAESLASGSMVRTKQALLGNEPHATMVNQLCDAVFQSVADNLNMVLQRILALSSWKFWEVKEYLNSSLMNPNDVVRYLGIPFLVLFVLYFLRHRFEKKDIFLWLPIGVFMFIYALVFRLASDIRYLFPVVPLAAVLAAKSIEQFKENWMKRVLLALCLLQFLMVSFYVYKVRNPSPPLKEGFSYIRKHIPEKAVVMYPEANLVEETNRKMIWGLGGVLNLFWMQQEDQMVSLIRENNLSYFIIKRDRIYDDQGGMIRHHGGYPKSFIERLPNLSFTKQVFVNPEMAIWQIEPPAQYLAGEHKQV